MRRFVKSEAMQIPVIALTTAIGAEIKVYPFHGDYFRMRLGASTFLFFLLLMRDFQPGFTTKYNEESGGTAAGSGLSHVREIVHSLDGEIAIGSSEEGIGTTFIVRLRPAK
ncbi:ATP-binding protein [Paenibacillus ehimensis]|uniref:ATP-binding protein n=1 Tax=Paenibacillus ehimensis TaxID=79264 RepID=UPI002DBC64B2|nr:ATP-binding protein [Paenibacillus ehimensis]MEC0212557.1 ATP-binding protein [Paenibacillus ehimensis]